MTRGWAFFEGELGRSDVRDLLAFHFDEMRAGSPRDACHVLDLTGLDHPAIRFMSLRDANGVLLGIGALKRLDDDHGELKSMRTAPTALGRGVGGAMLEHLIAIARTMGISRISLETGNSEIFAAANRLYEREGFERCGPFDAYRPTPFTHFYTRGI